MELARLLTAVLARESGMGLWGGGRGLAPRLEPRELAGPRRLLGGSPDPPPLLLRDSRLLLVATGLLLLSGSLLGLALLSLP